MNKSDIMKAAELAKIKRDNCEYADHSEFELLEALIAAAELLKQVEVLPEGSEPMVGDIIKMDCSAETTGDIYYAEYKGIKKDYAGTEYKMYWASGRAWKNDGNVPIQIIQRNGKPVTIEKEGV